MEENLKVRLFSINEFDEKKVKSSITYKDIYNLDIN